MQVSDYVALLSHERRVMPNEHDGSLDFIVFDFRKPPSDKKVSIVKQNWTLLERQNVVKANMICTGELGIPADKSTISQKKIFEAQVSQLIIPKDEVAILSAFPLFNFNYFKH